MSQAGAYISGVLGPAYTATIQLDVNGSQTNDTTLASAASNFNSSFPGNGFDSAGDVQRKILGNPDPSPGADGVVDWNFEDFVWQTGNVFQPGEIDFLNTAIHELTHAIGFASDIAQNGNSGFGDTPGNPSAWSPFDQFVADAMGSIIDSNGVLDGARWNAASIGGAGAGGLQFNGPFAVAANGGNPVYLYSPTTWSPGSSGSHLDTDVYNGTGGTIENMMNHASTLSEGLDIREYTAIELGMLCDIGYNQAPACAAIPEPSAFWCFGILAAGVVGWKRLASLRRFHIDMKAKF
ncbi:MAG: hypothetical protein KDA87_19600 [Planctomycetales bacterium]|nr:hypothetical protein [Planctomycetales bacterium]